MKRALAIAWLLAPSLAHAYPAHVAVEVKPGDVTFQRLFDVRALAVVDPSIATAELMPSQEILITGKKQGTTDVVALAGGKLVGLRVHVRATGTLLPDDSAEKLAAMEKACPKHKLVGDSADQELGVSPTTPACRTALFGLFATDKFFVKQISVDFDQETLQTQLQAMTAAVDAEKLPVKLSYAAITLVMQGTVTPAQASKLLVALYTHALGGVPLDDGELTIAEPDAGAAAPVQ